jgi:hypothetical protein
MSCALTMLPKSSAKLVLYFWNSHLFHYSLQKIYRKKFKQRFNYFKKKEKLNRGTTHCVDTNQYDKFYLPQQTIEIQIK